MTRAVAAKARHDGDADCYDGPDARDAEHDLYETGDADAPDCIKDRNGEVVLALCRACGQGEVELRPICDANKTQ